MSSRHEIPYLDHPAGSSTAEDPWDGRGVPASRTAIRVGAADWIWWILAITASLLLIGQRTFADDTRRPRVTVQVSGSADLDTDAKFLTEDYLELLEQLRHVTREYQGYFADVKSPEAGEYEEMLSDFYRVINDTNQYRDHNNLYRRLQELREQLHQQEQKAGGKGSHESAYAEKIADMEQYRQSLSEQLAEIRAEINELERRAREEDDDSRLVEERAQDLELEAEETRRDVAKAAAKIKLLKVRQQSASPNPHLSRLVHSLQQELRIISGLLSEEVMVHFDEEGRYTEAIDQYIKLAIEAAKQASSMELQKYVIFNREDPGHWTVELKGLEDLAEAYEIAVDSLEQALPEAPAVPVWTVPSVEEVPRVAAVPKPPQAGNVPTQAFVVLQSDRRSVTRRLVDSISVPAGGKPVYVVMPSANLKVVGWSEDQVTAQCEYVVRGESRDKSQKIADKIDLRMFNKGDEVYVETALPVIGDASSLQLAGTVTIMTPFDNPVILSSSFGNVSISDLTAGVKLSSRNSTVKMRDVSGNTEVRSTMGTVMLTKLSGQLEVSNSYGSLNLTDCNAKMQIENGYSGLSLNGCKGKVSIETTGATQIAGFDGQLDIIGNACPIMISDVSGRVQARTSFQGLDVKDVKGDAYLSNSHASIIALDIDGRVEAETSHGEVRLEAVSGPIFVDGDHGEVRLVVGRELSGDSRIKLDRGTVRLTPDASTDLLVVTRLTGGSLETDREMRKLGGGPDSNYEIKLGRGSNRLDIEGTSVRVFIDGR